MKNKIYDSKVNKIKITQKDFMSFIHRYKNGKLPKRKIK